MKSVLIVFETLFKYSWQGSAARILDFADVLAASGWECTFLAGRHEPVIAGEGLEEQLRGQIVRTPFSGIYPNSVRGRVARKLYRTSLDLSGRGHLYRDPESGWPARAVEWFIANNPQRPDLVMGMTTGHVGNLTAARLLAERFRAPLVLEFQDPCPSLDLKTVYPAELAALLRAVEAADLVLTTTRGLAVELAERYPMAECNFEPVHMSYDESIPPAVGRAYPDHIEILHAGSLAGGNGRNVRVVVEALARVYRTDPALADRIRLVLLGGGPGGEEAKQLAAASGVGGLVEVLPTVSRDEALARMARANVLLLVKYADPKYALQIPGKIFQYLGQGLPVLGIMSRESEAAEILLHSGLGVVYENADVDGVTEFLQRLATKHVDLVSDFAPDWEYIQQYSLGALGRRLDGLLTSVLLGVAE